MGTNKINIEYRRGGREFRRRTFNLSETRAATLGRLLREEGLTAGLDSFEVYVRPQSGDMEISAAHMESTSLESILSSVTEDGEIKGKNFVIDCTAEHRGAGC